MQVQVKKSRGRSMTPNQGLHIPATSTSIQSRGLRASKERKEAKLSATVSEQSSLVRSPDERKIEVKQSIVKEIDQKD
jgi:hypothetical protein